jgi:hypothetical protein
VRPIHSSRPLNREQRWVDIDDVGSYKNLFGFNKVRLSIGFQATKEEGSLISLEIIAK